MRRLSGTLDGILSSINLSASTIMKQFEEQKFTIPELKGISAKNIEEHLKLYSGYVKNTNMIMNKITELMTADPEKNLYVANELHRRFSFEFNGMRNHEHYFRSLEGGPKPLTEGSPLIKKIEEDAPFKDWIEGFKLLAQTRGVGWAVLYYDTQTDQLVYAWIDEQHLGQLNGLHWILGIDMWEHSFVADYQPSGKKQYIEDFFTNLNWSVIEENFKRATT